MFSSQKNGSVNPLNGVFMEPDDNSSSNLEKRKNQSDSENEFIPIVNTRFRRIRILETSSDCDPEVVIYLTFFPLYLSAKHSFFHSQFFNKCFRLRYNQIN